METLYCPALTRSERLLLRTSERSDLFLEKFCAVEDDSAGSNESRRPSNGDSITITEEDEQENVEAVASRSNRGSVTLSISTISSHRGSKEGSGSQYAISRNNTPGSEDSPRIRSSTRILSPSSSSRNMTDFDGGISPSPTSDRTGLNSIVLGKGGKPKDTHWFDTSIEYSGLCLPVRIPLATFPEEVGDVSSYDPFLSER
jgi:hypothetical protein